MTESLYQASLTALTNHGCPEELAQKASEVIANDNPDLPNLGRSTEDQEIINQAVTCLNGGDTE